MIPIENSVAGRVADIHHLMPHSGLHIVGEHFLPVRHQLLAPKGAHARGHQDGREPRPRARPVPQDHPQARHQADRRRRHRRLGPRGRRESATRPRAAIAPRLAAEIYGLDILAEDIEDEDHNTTRFIVLSREAKWAKNGDGPVVTTFVFRVRNVPAALYKALGGFATNGVNMTKLESYMVEGNFSATQFYADIEGHPDERRLVFALRGARLLLQGNEDPRRLSGASVPRQLRGNGGLNAVTRAPRRHTQTRDPPRDRAGSPQIASTSTCGDAVGVRRRFS